MAEGTNTRDIRRSRSRSQRLTRLTLILVGLVLLAGSLYSLCMYALSNMAGLDAVQLVSWEQTVSGPAWSFQREYVTYTDAECLLIPIVDEGERVSKGLEIARLNYLGENRLSEPSNRRLYSQVAGIVSYETDGLELISELKDYQSLSIRELDGVIGPDEPVARGSQGLAGMIQDKVLAESRGAEDGFALGSTEAGSHAGTGATGTGTAGVSAPGTGLVGSSASGSGAAGAGSVGAGPMGSGAAGSGSTGSGAAGAGSAGSGSMGSGAAGAGSTSTNAAGTGNYADPGRTPALVTGTKMIASHSPVMKVTDNLSDCYVYIRLPAQDEAPFSQGDRIRLRLEGSGEGSGSALECEEIHSGWGLLVKLDFGLEALRHSRKHQLVILLGTQERCAVPAGTVVMKDGEIGVYVAEKNYARWRPVVIVEERDGLQIIEGQEADAILPGDVVVTRPWLIWDGMRLQG